MRLMGSLLLVIGLLILVFMLVSCGHRGGMSDTEASALTNHLSQQDAKP